MDNGREQLFKILYFTNYLIYKNFTKNIKFHDKMSIRKKTMKKHGFQLILISLFVMLGFYLIGFYFLNEHKIIFEQTKEEILHVNYKDA